MQRIKKGDYVVVVSGKNKGAGGLVLAVLNKKGAALVEGVNKVKRHQKGDDRGAKKSEIADQEAPIRLCKLALVDSKNKAQQPTRIRYSIDEKTKLKIRVSKKTNNAIGGK